MRELEISAKTVEEATRVALAQLQVTQDEVDIIVLKKGKSGVLGMGAEDAKIKVILLEDEKQPGAGDDAAGTSRQVLSDILHAMGIQATVDVSGTGDEGVPVTLNIEGDDLGVLIGRQGTGPFIPAIPGQADRRRKIEEMGLRQRGRGLV